MNIKSLRVWMILALCAISLVIYGGDSTYANAKITDPSYLNPTQSDTPTADVNSDEVSEQASADFGLWDYIKVLFSLIFVIGLLIVVLRFLNKKNMAYQQTNMMHSLGGVSVGPQKSVQLVKVGGRILVVGVGDDVKLLANIDDEAEVEHLINMYEDQFNQTAAKPYIFQLLTRKKDEQSSNAQTKPFGEMLNSRLSEIKKERREGLERWKDKESDKE